MMRSSNGRLMTLAPMVPLPEIKPSSQRVAAWELMNPRAGTASGPDAAAAIMGSAMAVRLMRDTRELVVCFMMSPRYETWRSGFSVFR